MLLGTFLLLTIPYVTKVVNIYATDLILRNIS